MRALFGATSCDRSCPFRLSSAIASAAAVRRSSVHESYAGHRQRRSDLLQGHRADLAETLPGVPSQGPGRAVWPGNLRAGPQASLGHFERRRRSRHASVEGCAAFRIDSHEVTDRFRAPRSRRSHNGPTPMHPRAIPPIFRHRRQFPEGWTLRHARPRSSTRVPTSRCRLRAKTSIAASWFRPILPNDVYISGIDIPARAIAASCITSCRYVDTSAARDRRKTRSTPRRAIRAIAGPGVDSIGDMGGWVPGH